MQFDILFQVVEFIYKNGLKNSFASKQSAMDD